MKASLFFMWDEGIKEEKADSNLSEYIENIDVHCYMLAWHHTMLLWGRQWWRWLLLVILYCSKYKHSTKKIEDYDWQSKYEKNLLKCRSKHPIFLHSLFPCLFIFFILSCLSIRLCTTEIILCIFQRIRDEQTQKTRHIIKKM